MASQLNGYALVPHNTYNVWRKYALTHGVNVDYAYGNQCWDICALLWYQYGLRLQTGNGYAFGCWTLKRNVNAVPPFRQIRNLSDVRRGDVIVLNRSTFSNAGHICFADEDYHGGSKLKVLGQNQGQGIGVGKASNIINMSMKNFLGAFRNIKWMAEPDPAPVSVRKSDFPWVLYANKLRNK